MKFRPLGDRVVVRRIKEDQKTPGGIIIPDTVAEKPQEGEVISAGPGAPDNNGKLVPTTVKDRKSTCLNSSHIPLSRMPYSA